MNCLLLLETQSNFTWLQYLEAFNYIAIILLTFLALVYAIKSYKFQSKESFNIICRLKYLDIGNAGYARTYGLEIYNDGNIVAKDVEIVCEGKRLAFIEFFKPEEIYSIPLGRALQVMSGAVIPTGLEKTVTVEKGKDLLVEVNVAKLKRRFSKNIKMKLSVSTDAIFAYQFSNDGSLKDIENSINKLTREVEKIEKKIK